jgi:2-polyprenyl-6-methoxyphenol hydroxylase-like FAD-dependent oxidoreductase
MKASSSSDTVALVVGAGPVGLAMACELLRHGVPCRVVEQNAEPTPLTQSRALAIQARTLESLENLGATERLLAQGRKVYGLSAFHAGRRIIHLTLDLDALDTPYPFILTLRQGQTERTLIELFKARGGSVEWRTRLTHLKPGADLRATLVKPDGAEETVSPRWLIGCDGARSVVRQGLDLAFEGTTYEETFLLADVQVDWDRPDDEGTLVFAKDAQVGAFPLPEPGTGGSWTPAARSRPTIRRRWLRGSKACSLRKGSRTPASKILSGSRPFEFTVGLSTRFARGTASWPETRRTSIARPVGRA